MYHRRHSRLLGVPLFPHIRKAMISKLLQRIASIGRHQAPAPGDLLGVPPEPSREPCWICGTPCGETAHKSYGSPFGGTFLAPGCDRCREMRAAKPEEAEALIAWDRGDAQGIRLFLERDLAANPGRPIHVHLGQGIYRPAQEWLAETTRCR